MNSHIRKISPADLATLINGISGFAALIAAATYPMLSARFILFAAIADGLDGMLARNYGSSPYGPHLDSLADTITFIAVPPLLLTASSTATITSGHLGLVVLTGTALYIAAGLLRLSVYTVEDSGSTYTTGVPTTLSATIIATLVLVGVGGPLPALGLTVTFAFLMVSSIRYPDLRNRDALIMGGLQTLAIIAPVWASSIFPVALLGFAVAYLLLGPWFYSGRTPGVSPQF